MAGVNVALGQEIFVAFVAGCGATFEAEELQRQRGERMQALASSNFTKTEFSD